MASLEIDSRPAAIPQVNASPQATIVADGFSCREQIEQATGRATLHIAELLAQSGTKGRANHANRA